MNDFSKLTQFIIIDFGSDVWSPRLEVEQPNLKDTMEKKNLNHYISYKYIC